MTHDPLVSDHVQRTIAIRDGRTSTETVHRDETASGITERHAGGAAAVRVSEEYAVLDQAGRLQLPRAHVEALGLSRRVKLRLEADHIGIWPDRDPVGRPSRPSSGVPATAPAPESPHGDRTAPAPRPPEGRHRHGCRPRPMTAVDAEPPPPTPQPPRTPQR